MLVVRRPYPGRALVVLAVAVVGFLSVNLATADRSPTVWRDEVMFADPAIHLAPGHGFTTAARFQPRESFFAGNSPLDSLCLFAWVRVFGVNITSVRAFNHVLILGVVAPLGLAPRRLESLRSTAPHWLLAVFIVCGDGVVFSYRSARPLGRARLMETLHIGSKPCELVVYRRPDPAVADDPGPLARLASASAVDNTVARAGKR